MRLYAEHIVLVGQRINLYRLEQRPVYACDD